jgi:hypothetical protein
VENNKDPAAGKREVGAAEEAEQEEEATPSYHHDPLLPVGYYPPTLPGGAVAGYYHHPPASYCKLYPDDRYYPPHAPYDKPYWQQPPSVAGEAPPPPHPLPAASSNKSKTDFYSSASGTTDTSTTPTITTASAANYSQCALEGASSHVLPEESKVVSSPPLSSARPGGDANLHTRGGKEEVCSRGGKPPQQRFAGSPSSSAAAPGFAAASGNTLEELMSNVLRNELQMTNKQNASGVSSLYPKPLQVLYLNENSDEQVFYSQFLKLDLKACAERNPPVAVCERSLFYHRVVQQSEWAFSARPVQHGDRWSLFQVCFPNTDSADTYRRRSMLFFQEPNARRTWTVSGLWEISRRFAVSSSREQLP